MDMNIFEYATRNKLRFPSSVGDLTAEQLWDLPLTSKDRPNLNKVAQTINSELKAITEESFVRTATDPREPLLTVALDIVKHVIAAKQEAAATKAKNNEKAIKRAQLMEALEARERNDLNSKTKEEILAELNALD